MRTKYSALTLGLSLTALAAALSLPTPAEACFQVVGSAPNLTVQFNSSLSPPGCINATTFDNSTAANAYAAAQNALFSSPSSPSSPGNSNSPFDSFNNAQDAFNQGNTAPGAQTFPPAADFANDLMNAAISGGYGTAMYNPYDPAVTTAMDYADADGDGMPDNDQDADGIDDNTGEFLYSTLVENIDRDRDGKVDADADADGDGLPDNDQDADGYDDKTGAFLYSTLVVDIDKDRDGKVDADAPGCGSSGQCDVAGFLDDLSGQSCGGGGCDVGDVMDGFQAAVNVQDSGRISGFTLIEGGCDAAGECEGGSGGNWPNVMVQVLDLDGVRNSGSPTVEPMHISGSGGPTSLDIDGSCDGSECTAPGNSQNDFYANPSPRVIGSRTTRPTTGVRAPAIVSYESITVGLENALINDGPGHSNQSRVILDNADDPDTSPAAAGEQFPWYVPNNVTVTTVERGSATGGGGAINPGSFAVTVDNGVIQSISVVPLAIANSTVSGNTAGGGGGITSGGPVSIPNSTVSGNTAGGTGGGGLVVSTSGGWTLTIIDSTVSGNTAGGGGAAPVTPAQTEKDIKLANKMRENGLGAFLTDYGNTLPSGRQ